MKRINSHNITNFFIRLRNGVIDKLNDKVFLTALAIAASLWALYTLSGTFTTVITLPVHIEGGVASVGGNQDKILEVECKVTGTGFKIFTNVLFTKLILNTSDLKVTPIEGGEFEVDIPTFEKVLDSKIADLDVHNIYTNRIILSSLTQATKNVKVDLDMEFKSDGLYMLVGDIIIEPSHIDITGESGAIDVINSVVTRHIEIASSAGNVSGEVKLLPIRNTTFSQTSVFYYMRFERYVEKRFTKAITIRNSNGALLVPIPSTVDITLNVAENVYNEFDENSVEAFIDVSKRDDSNNNIYLVEIDGLPRDAEVLKISPDYIRAAISNIN